MKHSFKKSFMLLLTFLMLVVNVAGVTPAYAATLVVTTSADSGAGSLRNAIAGATAGDTITFDAGLFGQTIHLASTLILDKNLTIDGSSLVSQITISGDTAPADGTGDVRVFIVNAGVTAVLKNLTISRGLVNALGTGYDAEGGGILNLGTLTISNSTIRDNTVTYAPADKEAGGGISNRGNLTVTNTTFRDNVSTLIGGGLYNNPGGTVMVANSTFSGNSATIHGGGIFNAASMTVINSTISGNSSGPDLDDGGGIFNHGFGTLNYANTIVANSTSGGDCFNSLGTLGTNLNNLVEDGGCTAVMNGDPGLSLTLANNGGPNQTFALLPGSPALGAGHAATCAASPVSNRDQRGRVRPQGDPNCDIGAYESSTGPDAPVVTAPTSGSDTNDATPTISGTAEPYSLVNVSHNQVAVCSNVAVNGLGNWSCVSTALPEGAIQLVVNATAGAGGTSVDTTHSVNVDITAPTVVSIQRADPDNTSAASVDFTVTFSEPVTGVTASDFTLHVTGNVTGATIDNVTGSLATYTVTVNTGTKRGTIRLDVPDTATASDAAGNALSGLNLPFETGEEYIVFKTNGADTTGVFRPTNGALYLKHKNETGFADVQINYGLGGDYPVVGDWDGNGTVTIGIYRNGSFYLRNENTIGFADIVFPFGAPGDQPVAGDWDGDGDDTIGVYRNGAFFLRNSNDAGAPDMTFALGIPGDVGIAGDWNNDGMVTTGVFRPSNGALYLKNTNVTGFADIQINYGLPGDKPVTGDWDGDGDDTIGIYRDGAFYLRNSNTIGFADMVFALGIPGDHPIAGNWDGQP